MKTNQWIPLTQAQKQKLKPNKYMNTKKLPRGEKQIRNAINLVSLELDKIKTETRDEDIKYEIGKAWGIIKEYLNI